MSKKPALGKGLSALLENSSTDITSKPSSNKLEHDTIGSISNISVEDIETNPFQPRTKFEKEALLELAESIKEFGIIQPLTVRKLGYGKYQLISGERRYRASQIAGLKEVPCYIRVANDQAMLEMALIENIQREDLDAIEVALSYQKLMEECNLTQEQLSERVSKKRSTISNYLRLLKLPVQIQLAIRDKKITMGHARTLINLPNEKEQLELFQQILDNNLSVRQIESLTKQSKAKNKPTAKTPLSFSEQRYVEEISNALKTKVTLKKDNKGKGKLVIPFKSEEDLERIIDLLGL
jgi:ParB family chromosome partitioning protein